MVTTFETALATDLDSGSIAFKYGPPIYDDTEIAGTERTWGHLRSEEQTRADVAKLLTQHNVDIHHMSPGDFDFFD